jgi:hypothetical protein
MAACDVVLGETTDGVLPPEQATAAAMAAVAIANENLR